MIDNILIHTITVNRRTKTGTNDLGEPTYSTAAVYTGIKARVESYRPKIEYQESGQDPTTEIIVYVAPDKTILSGDIIIAVDVPSYSASEKIGTIKEEVAAIKGTTTTLHHREFMIERT